MKAESRRHQEQLEREVRDAQNRATNGQQRADREAQDRIDNEQRRRSQATGAEMLRKEVNKLNEIDFYCVA
ncbi:unnamed protein product [Amoebophrya sp. A25]|nr:unnamed protein product [Amoebophrya sp. A25]|eukprot:GSA25T00021302001.1